MVKHGFHNLNIPIVYSHGAFLTDDDVDLIRRHDQYLSITPESEMHYGHGQVGSRGLHDQASIGVDTNFTFSGDVLLQARLWLQSMRSHHYEQTLAKQKIPRLTPMSVVDAFLLATRNGGRALRRGRDDVDIGVLKVGAKADVVCFDGTSPNMLGWTDPVAAVVLHSNVGDVTHVLVGGQFRKRDKKLVLKPGTGTWEQVADKFTKTASKIQEAFRTPPPLPDNWFGAVDFEDTTQVTAAVKT